MQRSVTAALIHGPLAQGAPARGAALHQIVTASALAVVLGAGLTWIAVATHAGRVPFLRRVGDLSERVSGLPAWPAFLWTTSGTRSSGRTSPCGGRPTSR